MNYAKSILKNFENNSTVILIALMSTFGYVFAYQYETGYANYYGIPDYLVSIGPLETIFKAFIIYFIIFLLGLLGFIITTDFLKSKFWANHRSRFEKNKYQFDVLEIIAVLIFVASLISFPKY